MATLTPGLSSAMKTSNKTDEFFKPIDGVESAEEATEVESYCVNCENNGITKLLLTKIPFYKEVIISSFSCPHCHYSNNEIQSAGDIQKQGIEYNLNVKDLADLSRQIVKSDYASIHMPELELEIPSASQKGEITTVEGILQRIIEGLEQDQPRRKIEHPEDYAKLDSFLAKIHECKKAEVPFSLRLRDISGNSFISTPPSVLPGHKDERLHSGRFDRTREEDHAIGYFPENLMEENTETNEQIDNDQCPDKDNEEVDFQDEVLEFSTNCSNCGVLCSTKMKMTKIPYFKEVVVMASNCDSCGSRTNEVKSGSGIEEKGKRITLQVTSVDDLCRDVLKSETCSIEVPEVELEVGAGILGGKFTTLEGLLCNVKEQLLGENPLISGDSAAPEMREKMEQFCQKFDRLISCEVPFTVILDDPAGNSFLQNIYAPDDDPHMKVVDYERTFEQNEELGLNDMNTESTSLTAVHQ